MIKTTIIIILILLLLITLYSYYCLSSRMINFERARLEYILQKESEIADKEKNIKIVADCSNKNEQLSEVIYSINKIINNSGLGTSCEIKNNSINALSEQFAQTYNASNALNVPNALNVSNPLNTLNNINHVTTQSIGTNI